MTMGKRRRTIARGIDGLWQREVGEISPRSFAHRVVATEDLVLRFDIYKKLKKHRGCVNTVSFNGDGDILVSGSDDKMVTLWNWDQGSVKLAFHSGHTNNVFQAKIMPYTDDKTLVTCAADGQVRRALIREDGKVDTVKLAKHDNRAHKLALEPGSPYIFYSCGEDGLVLHFDLRTQTATRLFTCQNFEVKSRLRPIVHLNAIAIDPRNPNFFSVAGSDEYARLYDIRKYNLNGSTSYTLPADCFCSPHLIGDGQVRITGLAFSDQSELLVSYSDELIYLFSRNMGLGPDPVKASQENVDKNTKPLPQVYSGHRNCATVKGANFFGPSCEYVTSGSDCGRIFIWRKKDGKLLRAMEGDSQIVNCIEPHPNATVLASSGIDADVKIWTPRATEPASLPVNMDELKNKMIRWTPHIVSPHEMVMHILQMVGESSSDSREYLAGRVALLEYFYFVGLADGEGASENDNVIDPEERGDN
ncbi:uncharacterized protein [Aristolochia californica]|uniref:uncharacterized protein isoform X2 n=1 Tax=Aristolochia californica TaxID=171875 RepID=UPI0035DFEC3E